MDTCRDRAAQVVHLHTVDEHVLSLETGSQDFFAPARALYAAHGFVPCPPFGHYVDDPNSTYLTRTVRVPSES